MSKNNLTYRISSNSSLCFSNIRSFSLFKHNIPCDIKPHTFNVTTNQQVAERMYFTISHCIYFSK